MKYALLIALALAVVMSSALGAELTSLTDFETSVPVAGTSSDMAWYDWYHAQANAVDDISTATTPLAANGGASHLALATGNVVYSPASGPITYTYFDKDSYVSNNIQTLVYGKPILGPNGEDQTLRTGFYQGGSLFDFTKPATTAPGWDPEKNTVWYGDWQEKAGFTRDAFGWMSGKVASDVEYDANGCGVADNNWFEDAQLMVIMTPDTAGALVETSQGGVLKAGLEDPVVEKIVAHGSRLGNDDTVLYEAYAGASQTGSIKDIVGSDQSRVSGYGDFYGGFLDAWIEPSDYNNRIEFELVNEVGGVGGEPYDMTVGSNSGPRPEWVWWVD